MQNQRKVSKCVIIRSTKPNRKPIIKNFFSLSISLMLMLGIQTNIRMMTFIVYPNVLMGILGQIITNVVSIFSCFLLAPSFSNLFGYKKMLITIECLFIISSTVYFFPKLSSLISGMFSYLINYLLFLTFF